MIKENFFLWFPSKIQESSFEKLIGYSDSTDTCFTFYSSTSKTDGDPQISKLSSKISISACKLKFYLRTKNNFLKNFMHTKFQVPWLHSTKL